jgi:hypothetical protein
LGAVEPPLSSAREHERFLRQAVEKYANPGSDPEHLQLGMRHSVELLVYYLEQHQLKEAEQFAGELINNPYNVENYKYLGRIGKAIVLARQNKTEASNLAFLALLTEQPRNPKGGLDRLTFIRNQPHLVHEIALALDYNKANETAERPFPAKLEGWRHPLMGLRRGIPERPTDKKD